MSSRTAGSFNFQRRIPSSLERVNDVCGEIHQLLIANSLAEISFGLELAARESLNNAVLHGNCSDPGKAIQLELRGARKWITLSVEDEGKGFNWQRRRQAVGRDTNKSSGRGTVILALYAARTRYNRQGNRVTLWFHKKRVGKE